MAVNGTILIIKRDDTDAEEYLNPNVINIDRQNQPHMVSKPIGVLLMIKELNSLVPV